MSNEILITPDQQETIRSILSAPITTDEDYKKLSELIEDEPLSPANAQTGIAEME